jgi:hypothetical protein
MSLMPDPYVTSATINGGKVTLKVLVNDFTASEWVVISGQATQTNGAFAIFNETQQVPAQPNGDPNDPYDKNNYYLTVDGAPNPHQFKTGEDVSVFASVRPVSKRWFTVMSEPATQQSGVTSQAAGEVAGNGWTWKAAVVSQVPGDDSTSTATAGQGPS